jgi:glycosyltransferase involved in cell wall biosynthesis
VRFIVHAPNIHQGGGKALLLPLLEAAGKRSSVTVLIDSRLEIPEELSRSITITRIFPTISGRLAGEWMLRRLAEDHDTILCFGNLPPLFKIKGRCIIFIQNRYLVEQRGPVGFPLGAQLRLMIERVWLRTCHTHAKTVIVQTRTMQQRTQVALGRMIDVVALAPDSSGFQRRGNGSDHARTAVYDFLYVATGDPHKNHLNLLEAWKFLAAEGLYPSLCLTISASDHPELFRIIEQSKIEYKLDIHHVPARSWPDMQRLYGQSRALVYPSRLESFGLPLVEARQAGLSIIAAELDYVRDLIDPEETFDPESPLSIARAVKRFLHVSETPSEILTSDAFVSRLLAVQ